MSSSKYNLSVNVSTFLNNKWLNQLNSQIWKITESASKLSNNFLNSAIHFNEISELTWTLKEKLWWIFWNAIDEADKLNNSMVGLKSIVEWTWNDFKQAEKFIQEFTRDWLVTTSEAANSLKNLLSSWYWLDEAKILMDRLKDSAAFGRAAHLDLWAAIQTATEWIKNENSVLVDNAWVSKNLSVIWDEYAKSIWKTAKTLTDAEKRQATLNWIIKETQFQVWDAKKLTEQYWWQKAKLNATIKTLSANIWQILLPILSDMMNFVTPIIQSIIDWSKENPWLAKTIIVLTAWLTGLLIIFTSLSAILPLLWWAFTILTWPIWLVVWAITAFVLAYQNNFLWIADITNWVLDKIWEFFDYVREGLEYLASVVYEYFERIKWPFIEFVDFILPFVEWFFNTFSGFFSNTFDNIILLLEWVWNTIKWIFQVTFWIIWWIVEVFLNIFTWNWEEAGTAIWDIVINLVEWIWNILKWWFQIIWSIVSQALDILTWFFSLFWEWVKTIFSIALKFLENLVSGVINWIVNIVLYILKFFWIDLSKEWENIKNVAFQAWNSLKDWLSAIWNWIWDAAKNIFTWIADSITGIFQGAIDFVKNAWDTIKWIWNSITWASDDIDKKFTSASNKVNSNTSISATWWRAYGWNVSWGKWYIVWERWPELFIPAHNWSVIPNNQLWWNIININMWWIIVKTEADEIRLIEKMKTELTRTLQLNKRGIL